MVRIPFFDYIAFLTLYIGCFVFIFKKFTEIIGFGLLFVVNAAFMIFIISKFLILTDDSFIPLFAKFAIFVGIVFHFISLLFVLMMINNLNKKYITAQGTPIRLPPIYDDKLYDFKTKMISCFSLGVVLISMVSFGYLYEKINGNVKLSVPNFSFQAISSNIYSIITVISSVSFLGLSINQIVTANDFSKLTRQELIHV